MDLRDKSGLRGGYVTKPKAINGAAVNDTEISFFFVIFINLINIRFHYQKI